MTRDDIIRMAREADLTDGIELPHEIEAVERFAALVAAAERNRTWTQNHWTEYERSIAAAEREACAELCIELAPSIKTTTAYKRFQRALKVTSKTREVPQIVEEKPRGRYPGESVSL